MRELFNGRNPLGYIIVGGVIAVLLNLVIGDAKYPPVVEAEEPIQTEAVAFNQQMQTAWDSRPELDLFRGVPYVEGRFDWKTGEAGAGLQYRMFKVPVSDTQDLPCIWIASTGLSCDWNALR